MLGIVVFTKVRGKLKKGSLHETKCALSWNVYFIYLKLTVPTIFVSLTFKAYS